MRFSAVWTWITDGTGVKEINPKNQRPWPDRVIISKPEESRGRSRDAIRGRRDASPKSTSRITRMCRSISRPRTKSLDLHRSRSSKAAAAHGISAEAPAIPPIPTGFSRTNLAKDDVPRPRKSIRCVTSDGQVKPGTAMTTNNRELLEVFELPARTSIQGPWNSPRQDVSLARRASLNTRPKTSRGDAAPTTKRASLDARPRSSLCDEPTTRSNPPSWTNCFDKTIWTRGESPENYLPSPPPTKPLPPLPTSPSSTNSHQSQSQPRHSDLSLHSVLPSEHKHAIKTPRSTSENENEPLRLDTTSLLDLFPPTPGLSFGETATPSDSSAASFDNTFTLFDAAPSSPWRATYPSPKQQQQQHVSDSFTVSSKANVKRHAHKDSGIGSPYSAPAVRSQSLPRDVAGGDGGNHDEEIVDDLCREQERELLRSRDFAAAATAATKRGKSRARGRAEVERC